MSRRLFGCLTDSDFDAALVYGEHASLAHGFVWPPTDRLESCACEGGMVTPSIREPRRAVLDDAAWRRVFAGNAFEYPPRRNHYTRRNVLHRTLRALLAWLRQPSPWSTR